MSQIKLRKYWRGKTMKIGVFDYCSATIDIIDVDDEIVDAYDSVEEYLISHFGYNNSNMFHFLISPYSFTDTRHPVHAQSAGLPEAVSYSCHSGGAESYHNP